MAGITGFSCTRINRGYSIQVTGMIEGQNPVVIGLEEQENQFATFVEVINYISEGVRIKC